jgi:DNA-binding FrmR family transcriptional regulator
MIGRAAEPSRPEVTVMTTSTADMHAAPATPGYTDRRADHLRRLRKFEGQVRGIARMVEDDRYCIDVLTQVSAVNRALQEVAIGLLDDHVRHCVLHHLAVGGSVSQSSWLSESPLWTV